MGSRLRTKTMILMQPHKLKNFLTLHCQLVESDDGAYSRHHGIDFVQYAAVEDVDSALNLKSSSIGGKQFGVKFALHKTPLEKYLTTKNQITKDVKDFVQGSSSDSYTEATLYQKWKYLDLGIAYDMPIYTKGALYAALVALDYTERHEASLKSSIKFNEIQDEIPVLLEVVELPLMHSELYEDRGVKPYNVEQWFHSVLKRYIFHLTDSLWTDIGSTTNLSSPVDTKLRFFVVMFSSNGLMWDQIFDPGINLSVLKLLVDLGCRQMDYYWSGFNVTPGDIADFYSRKAFRLILKDSSTLALYVIEKLSLAYLVESLLNSFKSINIGIHDNFQNLILLAKLRLSFHKEG
ncbi:hypothetical protein Leryth_024588 [Lithospermum erythrorhizon]|nr:hypothetical protein Leryth_024588 [Lithospermum erythrorhizon]